MKHQPTRTMNPGGISVPRLSTQGLEMMTMDEPMTPPMTPSESDDSEDPVNLDLEAQYADVDAPMSPAASPRGPQRLLEEEHVHIMKSGMLHLKDFEIRGTLGMSILVVSGHYANSLFRYWNFRSRAPRSAKNSTGTCDPILCHEGSSKI